MLNLKRFCTVLYKTVVMYEGGLGCLPQINWCFSAYVNIHVVRAVHWHLARRHTSYFGKMHVYSLHAVCWHTACRHIAYLHWHTASQHCTDICMGCWFIHFVGWYIVHASWHTHVVSWHGIDACRISALLTHHTPLKTGPCCCCYCYSAYLQLQTFTLWCPRL